MSRLVTRPNSRVRSATWAVVVAVLAVPALVLAPSLVSPPTVPDARKLVQVCLYTWYGTPDGPAGHYFLRSLQRTGRLDQWDDSGTTLASHGTDNATGAVVVAGNATTAGQAAELAYSLEGLPGSGWINPNARRTYFEVNLSASTAAGTAWLSVRRGGVTWATRLLNASDAPGEFHVVRRVLPVHFSAYPDPGPDRAAVNFTAGPLGGTTPVELAVAWLNLSQWTHYDEDYHAYEDPETGFWYNDPPGHAGSYKATAHNAYFPGDPVAGIPSYGFYDHSKWSEPPFLGEDATSYGIYDSLNATVIEAQLKLMERAGVDTCVIMHPWGLDVVRLVLDVAEEANSNLTFTYYGSADPDHVWSVLNEFGSHEKWFRVDGRPVYYWGFTGGMEEPFAVYADRARRVREAGDVFLVADVYSSPYTRKEEFLTVVDAWYYYDTSAFYRHGWGDPRVRAYQPDGSWRTGSGDLDVLYGSLAKMVHGHGKVYVATVIPGTDNTVVHDFTGRPLADGRPGTVNLRTGGVAFNETWQAAIDAGADWVNIVSWNELHEGTEIEPTLENGTFYVDLCRVWADQFKAS
ncbi:MAG: hypothetical protein Kow0069_35720 [Promethearchaeota archaeon]